MEAMAELHVQHSIFLTWDEEAEEQVAGSRITFVPLWKWLIDDEKMRYCSKKLPSQC